MDSKEEMDSADQISSNGSFQSLGALATNALSPQDSNCVSVIK